MKTKEYKPKETVQEKIKKLERQLIEVKWYLKQAVRADNTAQIQDYHIQKEATENKIERLKYGYNE